MNGERYTGPTTVCVTFRFDRPKSLPKRVQAHLRKPDLDKLTRAVLDALTPVAWPDDAVVVSLVARKLYALPGELPGALIVIEDATPEVV